MRERQERPAEQTIPLRARAKGSVFAFLSFFLSSIGGVDRSNCPGDETRQVCNGITHPKEQFPVNNTKEKWYIRRRGPCWL